MYFSVLLGIQLTLYSTFEIGYISRWESVIAPQVVKHDGDAGGFGVLP